MNQESISRQCKAKGFYRTPEFNEQLYLHFSGYSKIENLDAFTACRVLWLEHNLIETIENLEGLSALRVVHLEHNKLRDLGSCPLPGIETLGASHNFVQSLKGLSNFPNLQRLYLNSNDIEDDQIDQLRHTPDLVALDLGRNKLSDPETVLAALSPLKSLKSLILSGNDVVRRMPGYRKRLISSIPTLMHLDEMPVFENERRTAEAWARGGKTAEAEESKLIKQEELDRRVAQRDYFERFLEDARARGSTHNVETTYARTMRLAAEEEAEAEARKAAAKKMHTSSTDRPADDDEDDDDDDIVVAAPPSRVDVPKKKAVVHHFDPFAMAPEEKEGSPPTQADGVPSPASEELSEGAVLAALQLTPGEQSAFIGAVIDRAPVEAALASHDDEGEPVAAETSAAAGDPSAPVDASTSAVETEASSTVAAEAEELTDAQGDEVEAAGVEASTSAIEGVPVAATAQVPQSEGVEERE